MHTRFFITPLLAGAVLVLASCSGNGTVTPPQGTASGEQNASTASSASASMPAPPYHLIEAPLFGTSKPQSSLRKPAQAISTIPFWSDQFSFGGSTFPFAIIGTSPFSAPATTVVQSEIQPLTIVFSNGTSIDGAGPAAALAASPVFHSAVFPTETGQFIDVMQRANFNVVGTRYHVRLGTPTVLPAITIAVPSKFGKAGLFSNHTIGLVDFNFMFNALQNVLAARNFNTTTLPVLVVGNVFEYIPPGRSANSCCIGGFHFAQLQGASGIITFAFTAYNSPGIFAGDVEDMTIASHEVAEWGNDPLINNVVPPWGFPTNPSVCVNNLLEVGDPLEVFASSSYPVTLNGTTYHPQDIAFFSWFAHQVPSIARNGQYSYLTPEKLTAPPAACQ
jgi:hypothetical protein